MQLEPNRRWTPDLNWNSQAGQALLRLLSKLPPAEDIEITVFGSAPLQLGIDPSFLSADVDVFSETDLKAAIEQAGLTKNLDHIYIEQNPEYVFSAAHTWRGRAFVHHQGSVALVFPHPIDILVAKVKRVAPRDLNAFRLVIARTGQPTAADMKVALQRNVDMFRPNFDQERGAMRLLTQSCRGAKFMGPTSIPASKSSRPHWRRAGPLMAPICRIGKRSCPHE